MKETLHSQEQRRRQTLLAIGIEPLVSRFDAPFGKVSVRFAEPEISAAQAPMDEPAVDKDFPTAKQHPDVSSKLVNSPRATPLATPNDETVSDKVEFHLLLVSAGGWLWIESLDDGLLHKEQLALVHNMAIAVSDASADLVHRQFVWPMAEHPHLPRDAVAARQSLGAQLERIGKETPYRGIVLMGETVSKWVSEELHAEAVVIPSARQMLQTPTLKRDAWSVLRPLSQVANAKKGD